MASGRHSRRGVLLVDSALAGILALLSLALLLLPYRGGLAGLPPVELAGVIVLATTLPLALRRAHPNIILVVVSVTYITLVELDVPQTSGPSIALLVALFSAGAYASAYRRVVRGGAVVALLGYVILHLIAARDELGDLLPLYLLAAVPLNAFLYLGAWLMGDWFRDREMYERELDRRARALERDRLGREQRVVQDERVRIARELHDVVAHHVSVMGIQAGAARSVLPAEPTRAHEILLQIESSSRNAVQEMRRLLSALRRENDLDGPPKGDSLDQVQSLIENVRDAGLQARLAIVGIPVTLPETLGLSAYRIVQESLTNVIKHAHAKAVTVTISYREGRLEVAIEDDGTGDSSSIATGGRGIVGMRERVGLFGGHLVAGPRQEGGFLVRAIFPLST